MSGYERPVQSHGWRCLHGRIARASRCGGTRLGYREDREWSDGLLDQVSGILHDNAPRLVDASVTSDSIDRNNATDMVVQLSGSNVAIRLRRASCKKRDFTIRSKRRSGYKTELHKLMEGFGDLYLYGWVNANERIEEWILIDLDELREKRLWSGKKEIPNGDGTWFIAIEIDELYRSGCLVAYELNGELAFQPTLF